MSELGQYILTRPDHVHCINKDYFGVSWCGRSCRNEWHFQNIDHAASHRVSGGRMRACKFCTDEIIKGLSSD